MVPNAAVHTQKKDNNGACVPVLFEYLHSFFLSAEVCVWLNFRNIIWVFCIKKIFKKIRFLLNS